MMRISKATVLVLLSLLPALSFAQANVLIHTSDRYADQFQMFRDSGVAPMLSKLASSLGPDFTFVTKECGVVNAWYSPGERSITLCYEYLADADAYFQDRYQNTNIGTRAAWSTGVFIHVLFHELAHAAIDVRNIPVLGGQEDAADRFSTIMLLETAKSNPVQAKAMITGSLIYQWNTRPSVLQKLIYGRRLYANEHPLTEQRVYNIVCLAYGSNPALFQDLAQAFRLPQERAVRCPGEYRSAETAVKQLFK